MFHGLLTLMLVALAIMATVGMEESGTEEVVVDMNGDLSEDEKETTQQTTIATEVDQELDPRLTPTIISKIFSKLSARCSEEIQENPTDPTNVSDRCRMEVASRIQRYLARIDKEVSGDSKEKKDETIERKKHRSRKSKKQTRAQRKAAAAQKKEEEYQKTLQIIVGFVVTLVVVIASAMFFINRKLKDAGMYFPNPNAKATCCD